MIICDTGPLYAAGDRKDDDHHRCVELFTGLRLARRRLLVPATVVAEVGYLLESRIGSYAEAEFLTSVGNNDFELIDLTDADALRMAELVQRYSDLPLGTTDASVIALAERLNLSEVANPRPQRLHRRPATTSRRPDTPTGIADIGDLMSCGTAGAFKRSERYAIDG